MKVLSYFYVKVLPCVYKVLFVFSDYYCVNNVLSKVLLCVKGITFCHKGSRLLLLQSVTLCLQGSFVFSDYYCVNNVLS